MKIKMTLLSDTIFGNGESIPGGEDIALLTDEKGFPYYKGSTFKGVFREELERLKYLDSDGGNNINIDKMLGSEGNDDSFSELVFGDFCISDMVKDKVSESVSRNSSGCDQVSLITDIFTNIRTFTAINEYGTAKKGSLRMARCVDKGISFYSEIICDEKYEDTVREVLNMIKWIGTMRNRGFGKVKITEIKGVSIS